MVYSNLLMITTPYWTGLGVLKNFHVLSGGRLSTYLFNGVFLNMVSLLQVLIQFSLSVYSYPL